MNNKRRIRRLIGLAAAPIGLLIGAAIPALTAMAQVEQQVVVGSGNIITEERQVSGFRGVAVGGVGILKVTVGNKEALSIEAEDNVLPVIKSEVKNGTLYIGFKEKTNVRQIKTIHYNLTVKSLDTLKMSGATEAEVGAIMAERFSLDASGASKVRFASLNAKELKVELSGATGLKLAGNVEKQTIQMSGAGKYEAGDVASKEATIQASGASKTTVRVSDKLTVHASGAVTVDYYGSPNVEKHTSGVSKVRQAN